MKIVSVRMKLVFATNNKHKLEEIRRMLPESYELISLRELGCTQDPPETHQTIEENALEKALFVYNRYKVPCFADDSGLEVDALNGEPGVFSARYAGEEKDPAKNIAKLLHELKEARNRVARFKTVIAYVDPGGHRIFTGTIQGEIMPQPEGVQGFGYDPVFRPDGYSVSFASMPAEEKNKISHRAKAFNLLINFLNK